MDEEVRQALEHMQNRFDKGFEKVFEKLDSYNECTTNLIKKTAVIETTQKQDRRDIQYAHKKIKDLSEKEEERTYKALKFAGALLGIVGGLAGAFSFLKTLGKW